MKSVLPILALVIVASFAVPTLASEQHLTHAGTKTVEAVPAPPPAIVVESAAQSTSTSEIKTDSAMSRPMGAAYENCNRTRKDKTVYLTQ